MGAGGPGGPFADGPYGAMGPMYPTGGAFGFGGVGAYPGGGGPLVVRAPLPPAFGRGAVSEPLPWDPARISAVNDGPALRAARPLRGQRQSSHKSARRTATKPARRGNLKAASGAQESLAKAKP
jgi:hypothetical protein